MVNSMRSFVDYFEGVRRRTLNYIRVLPPDRVDWAPKAGEMTCGDLLRHMMASEVMFVGLVIDSRWKYLGHERRDADTLETLTASFAASHAESMARLRTVGDGELMQPRPSLEGPPFKSWRFLMAMVEHEIHHRSQLAVYLTLMGVQPPHIYGMGVEDVIARATG
jgi:uncharacterized damage-inducible protein DinB